MKTFQGLRYSKDHEWVRLEGDRAYIGITNFAQMALGDIVFVELPKKGAKLKAGDTLGVVESVKTASDVYTPVSGEVIEINDELGDAPEKLNAEPYENHLAVLKLDNAAEFESLMNEDDYGKYCVEEA